MSEFFNGTPMPLHNSLFHALTMLIASDYIGKTSLQNRNYLATVHYC